MRRAFALAIGLAACEKSDEPRPPPQPPTPKPSTDKLIGTVKIGGDRLTLEACQPGNDGHTYVDVTTSHGTLRFRDGRMYFGTFAEELACEKLDRSWGGGLRTDGTAYWRGTLDFRCALDCSKVRNGCKSGVALPGIAGELELECGGITATERAQLDANRKNLLDEQHGSNGFGGPTD